MKNYSLRKENYTMNGKELEVVECERDVVS